MKYQIPNTKNQKPFRVTPRYSAFSLLEVLVAMVVISVAAVALGGFMMSSVRGLAGLDRFAVANFLAVDEIEKVRQLRDSNYVFYLREPQSRPRNWLNGIVLGIPSERNETISGISYRITRRADCVFEDGGGRCLKVKLNVTVTADNQPLVSLVGYLYDYLPTVEPF